jgi:hypothetical protein
MRWLLAFSCWLLALAGWWSVAPHDFRRREQALDAEHT